MLELEHTCKHYLGPGGLVRAVDDVSFSVRDREMVAIFGPSGSGKTTLLLLSAGLVQADTGQVRFDGVDLGGLSKREALHHRRTRLGFVFQNFNLIAGMSVEDNVLLPLLLRGVHHRDAQRRAACALADVGLSQRAQHMPTSLSGGEQQRVSIARALVGEPRLVFADEPTGNLDSTTGEDILEMLLGLSRDHAVTVIMVTHDARAARYADRTLTMCDGRLDAADGAQVAAVGT